MAREKMVRKAADNVYLHKDFHGVLSIGIEYLQQRYGPEAVREYLRQFASSFYAPLTEKLREQGLGALQEHLEQAYRVEGGSIEIRCSQDELVLEVEACPAVTHLRQRGFPVASLFYETSTTVYESICAGTPFACEWLAYDERTGRSKVRFYRRCA